MVIRKTLLAGVGVAVLATLSACTTSSTSSTGSSATASGGGPIVIGAAVAKTGFLNAFDGPGLTGLQVFVKQVNAAGGIDGRQIDLRIRDTASTTQGSKDAAEALISAGAQILVTNANFDFASPAANVAQAKNMLNISLGAAAPNYGVQGIGPQAYSPAPATYLEGHTMAQLASTQKWSKPFVLTDTSIDYGTQVGTGVEERLKQLSITPAGKATFKNGDSSIATQIASIKSSGADSIMLSSYLPGAGTAIRQIRAAGIDVPIVADLGTTGTDWLKAVPDLSNFYNVNLASIYGDDPNPAIQTFVKDFTAANGSAPATSQAIEGYVVGQLIQKAVTDAGGSTDGAALSGVLDKLTGFSTLMGPLTYTSTVHIKATGPLTILKYTKGKPAYFTSLDDVGTVDLHLN